MNRLTKIRAALLDMGLDALLITDEKNQRYASGFAFTDGVVIVTLSSAYLITDSRYIEAAEAAVSGDFTLRLFGAGRPLRGEVRRALEECGCRTVGAEDNSLSHAAYLGWEKSLGLELTACGTLFGKLRAAKDETEIQNIKAAQAIAEKALGEVLPLIREGISEREIAAELTYRMLRLGGEGNSFDPIAVAGENSSMPHGVPSDRLVRAGDFVTMDFGCIKNGYCSDMTRTVAVGFASDEMKNVYDIVLRAQKAGIAAAKAGVSGSEIDSAGRTVIESAGFGKYFGHSFGHSVGLDIHEYPVASPSDKAPMPVGAVVTAEPGIYLPGRFGVRIEDMLVLREGSCEIITKAAKDLIIL